MNDPSELVHRASTRTIVCRNTLVHSYMISTVVYEYEQEYDQTSEIQVALGKNEQLKLVLFGIAKSKYSR